MFPRELGSSTDKYRCLCTEKEFNMKFVWLFRYGSYLGDFVEARYCELIMLFGIDCSFFWWEASKVPTSVYLARQSCNLVI